MHGPVGGQCPRAADGRANNPRMNRCGRGRVGLGCFDRAGVGCGCLRGCAMNSPDIEPGVAVGTVHRFSSLRNEGRRDSPFAIALGTAKIQLPPGRGGWRVSTPFNRNSSLALRAGNGLSARGDEVRGYRPGNAADGAFNRYLLGGGWGGERFGYIFRGRVRRLAIGRKPRPALRTDDGASPAGDQRVPDASCGAAVRARDLHTAPLRISHMTRVDRSRNRFGTDGRLDGPTCRSCSRGNGEGRRSRLFA